jgi:hypothetical protein
MKNFIAKCYLGALPLNPLECGDDVRIGGGRVNRCQYATQPQSGDIGACTWLSK